MLKMLVLKIVKKYINIYKYKLSLFDRNNTKQAKDLFSLWSLIQNNFQKYKKNKKKTKRCQMLLEPIIIAIINLLNLQVVPDKAFLNYV